MNIFLNKEIVENLDLSNYDIATYVAIRSIYHSAKKEFYISTEMLAYELYGCDIPQRAIRQIKKSILSLAEFGLYDIIKTLNKKSDSYVIKDKNLYFDTNDEGVYFTIIFSDEVRKIMTLDSKKNKAALLRFFINVVGTFNRKHKIHTDTDTKTNFVGYVSQNYIGTFNFIPEAGEIFKQCDGIEESSYWFISNRGRLFTVYYKKEPLKQMNLYYVKSGIGRKQHDWYYVTQYKGKQREPRLHRLVAKYFNKNEFEGFAEVADEPLEVHHIVPESTFAEDEPFKANRSDNLQILPKSVHRDVTHIDRFEKKMEQIKGQEQKTICQISTQTLIDALQKHIGDGRFSYIIHNDDKKATARPLKKEPEEEPTEEE